MGVNILEEPKESMTCEKYRSQSSSTLPASRIMGVPVRAWKSRSKSQSRLAVTAKCQWSHEGPGRWRNDRGQLTALNSVPLLQTFEAERLALQKLGIIRLQELNLGCTLEVPKLENFPAQQQKKRTMLLRKKAVTTNFFDNKEREKGASLPVFGVPLSQCLANDRLRMRTINTESNVGIRTGQKDHREELLSLLRIFPGNFLDIRTQREESPTEARYLSPSMREELAVTRNSLPDIQFGELQVPLVVQTCIRFLKAKGLNTLGIFRVSGAQKRVRQLREDFDNNKVFALDESTQPHDVAQLLKEYFRDLPEPLLSRALYDAFLATQNITNPEQRLNACRWLLYLLPIVHRDTLAALLAFLEKVSQYAEDIQRRDGTWVAGNKMNAHNLATVFGPNLLRTSKSNSDSTYSIHSAEKAQERSDMILTVRLLIENFRELFRVPSADLDAIYLQFMLDDPDMLNAILSRRYDILMSEEVSDSSSGEVQVKQMSSGEKLLEGSRKEILSYSKEFLNASNSGSRDDLNVKSRIRPLIFASMEKTINSLEPERPRSKDRSDYIFGDRRPSGGSGKDILQSSSAVTAAFTIKVLKKGTPGVLPLSVVEHDQKPSPRSRRVQYGKARHLTTPAYVTEETITNITIPPPRNSYRGSSSILNNPSTYNRTEDSKTVDFTERQGRYRAKAMDVSKPVPVLPERWKRQEIIASEHTQL